MFGVVGSLLIIVLPNSRWICHWEKCRKRSIFSPFLDNSIQCPVWFGPPCINACQKQRHIDVGFQRTSWKPDRGTCSSVRGRKRHACPPIRAVECNALWRFIAIYLDGKKKPKMEPYVANGNR